MCYPVMCTRDKLFAVSDLLRKEGVSSYTCFQVNTKLPDESCNYA